MTKKKASGKKTAGSAGRGTASERKAPVAKKKAGVKTRAAAARQASAPRDATPPRKATPRKATAKTSAAVADKPKLSEGVSTEADGGGGLGVGDSAPNFELQDHSGNTLSSTELAGRPYVLYFYPKDDTPGCTMEACGFRDAVPEFEQLGVRVFGVSPDSVASHQRFSDKYRLTFPLLADEEKELASAYGVWALKKNYGREYMGIVRSTFLVGADGVIRKAWRGVRVSGHAADVRSEAEQLGE